MTRNEDTDADMIDPNDRERVLARWRKRRQRERRQLALIERRDIAGGRRDIVPFETDVTVPLTPCNPLPSVTPSVTTGLVTPRSASWNSTALVTAAGLMFGTGLAINAWFARSLGSTEFAGWLFLVMGVASDSAAFILPRHAGWLWRQRRVLASLMAWGLFCVTFAFALIASVGFASLNIADTTMARAVVPPTVEEAALAEAKGARDRECYDAKGVRRVGPVCKRWDTVVNERQGKLDEARARIAASADPQTRDASKLIAWLTQGRVTPSADDFAMLRLALLTLCPQIGGLLLMVARKG